MKPIEIKESSLYLLIVAFFIFGMGWGWMLTDIYGRIYG